MSDLISRAAAIGCLGNSPEQMCMPWSEMERMLRELPAVDAVPVVRCAVSDLISRAALLDEFHSLCGPQTGDGWDNMGVHNMIMRQKVVDAAPVVHGHWIGVEYDGYADGSPVYDLFECSICGEEHEGEYDTLTNYCPNCGAKMDGERRDNSE